MGKPHVRFDEGVLPQGNFLLLPPFVMLLICFAGAGGNHRLATLSTPLFFVGGLWLMMLINMVRGLQSVHDTT
ncbi:MAG: hypothetical protein Q7J20_03410 [Candidatus Nitrotoga sp.]|nr:hypothetical protein [Candidatus Nitrotoga sp.]MDO9446947.1 hypothetical protein [Candidatus Nitrotoga sp.]MDP3497832.1 hypothetical protein [Candidatus Nitrotoga sp.]